MDNGCEMFHFSVCTVLLVVAVEASVHTIDIKPWFVCTQWSYEQS